MEKVKLPREVAEAIDYYNIGEKFTKYGVLDCIVGEASQIAVKARGVLIEKYGQGECWDVVMQALVNGYEVEQTPEDKLVSYYEKLQTERDNAMNPNIACDYNARLNTVLNVLDILNIKIEGVNT